MYNNTEINVITEFENDITAKDIPIYIYKMRIKDIENSITENYKVIRKLSSLNRNNIIVFYKEYIASFSEILNWGDEEYINASKRPIEMIFNEKKLLERLLLEEIKRNADKKSIQIRMDLFILMY